MALAYADRVKETTATTSTGTYSLAGAETGFRTFVSGIGDGNTCYYCCTDNTDWEVGLGTVTDASPDTLSRDTILASSNAGSAVEWGEGTKDVFVTAPAGQFAGLSWDQSDDTITVGGNLLQGSGSYVRTDKVQAVDGDGLSLHDDGGNGIFVEDGGNVDISADSAKLVVTIQNEGTGADPDAELHLKPGTNGEGKILFNGDGFVDCTSGSFYFAVGGNHKIQLNASAVIFRDDQYPINTSQYNSGQTGNRWLGVYGDTLYATNSVGIGTDDPDTELHVDGSVTCDECVYLPNTTTDSTGIVFKGSDRFIHNFQHPTGDTAVPEGNNTFVGVDAGNFTTGSAATLTKHGSRNTALGWGSMNDIANGYDNVSVGYYSLPKCTNGGDNFALGSFSLAALTTTSHNVCIGTYSGFKLEGGRNLAIGYLACQNSTGDDNVFLGHRAGAGSGSPTSVSKNIAIGVDAGRGFASGAVDNILIGYKAGEDITTGTDNIIIGYDVEPTSATATHELNIGNLIYGDLSTGLVGIGTDDPDTELHVDGDVTVDNGKIFFTTTSGWGHTHEILNDGYDLRLISERNIELCAGGITNDAFAIANNGTTVGNSVHRDYNLELFIAPALADVATKSLWLHGQNAYASASTNLDGGPVYIYGGTKTDTGADGNVVLAHNGTTGIGLVGIGTTGPNKKLEINTGAADDGIRISYNDADGSATNYSEFITGADGDLTITTVDSDGAVGHIALMPDGYVGVNESSPDYTLDVNGSFGFTPGSGVTPVDNGDVVIEATDNTTLTFKLKGSDGIVRTATLTLSE